VWFALRVFSRAEFSVENRLASQGVQVFLPAVQEQTRWSDRTQIISRPLLPGYLFIKVDPAGLPGVFVPGVIEILKTDNRAAAIPAEEIDQLRRAIVASRKPVAECPYVAGDKVTVARGPMAGSTGIVQRTKAATRLVISIEILHRSVSVEIAAEDVE
jgi:transcriptional antiterminator RfaH